MGFTLEMILFIPKLNKSHHTNGQSHWIYVRPVHATQMAHPPTCKPELVSYSNVSSNTWYTRKNLCVPRNWAFQHATRILDVIMLEYPLKVRLMPSIWVQSVPVTAIPWGVEHWATQYIALGHTHFIWNHVCRYETIRLSMKQAVTGMKWHV